MGIFVGDVAGLMFLFDDIYFYLVGILFLLLGIILLSLILVCVFYDNSWLLLLFPIVFLFIDFDDYLGYLTV